MQKNNPAITKKSSPPPIVFISLFLAALAGGHWFLTHKTIDSSWETNQSNSRSVINSTSDRISIGDKILVTADATSAKKAGIRAFFSNDYKTAIANFKSSLKQRPNNPETSIYLNNARWAGKKALKITVSVPIGSNLNVAQEILRGVAQAQDEVNRNGGINGTPVRIAIANDENNPEIAKEISSYLVKDEQTLAVIGHNASDASLAAAPIYQQGKLVMITPTSSAMELTGFGNYIFRTMLNQHLVAKNLAEYIVKRDRKTKIAVCFDPKSAENQLFRDIFISAVMAEGGKVVSTVCDFSAPNFNPNTVVAQAIAEGAEGLLLNPHIDRFDPALAVARANQGRLTLYSTSTMYTFKTLQGGQTDVNGLVLAVAWHPQTNSSKAFAARARQYWGGTVNWRTAMAYDAAQAIVTGLRQKNTYTREGLQQALHSPGFQSQGAGGEIEFLPSGDRLGKSVLIQVRPSASGYDFVPVQP